MTVPFRIAIFGTLMAVLPQSNPVPLQQRVDRAIQASARGWVLHANDDRPPRRPGDGTLLRWRRPESKDDLTLLVQECVDASAAERLMQEVAPPVAIRPVSGVGDAAFVAQSGATVVYFRVGRIYAQLLVPVSGATPDTPAESRSSPIDVALRIAQRVARELANQ